MFFPIANRDARDEQLGECNGRGWPIRQDGALAMRDPGSGSERLGFGLDARRLGRRTVHAELTRRIVLVNTYFGFSPFRVATAVNGFSGQWCLGYLRRNSFRM